MSTYILGSTATLQATFTDVNGVPTDPVSVQFVLTYPNGTTASSTPTRLAQGLYSTAIVTSMTDLHRWEFSGGGIAIVGAFVVVSATEYPFSFGYCDVTDVQTRILAGQWDPSKAGAYPTKTQVNQLITEASALIDGVLGKSGYTLPLVVRPGFGNGAIMHQAWDILRNICAAYVTSHVEQTRHGSNDKNADKNAETWMKYADDMLGRIESGAENLTLWGVAGGFEPDPDPAQAVQLGSVMDLTTGMPKTPVFTIGMKF